MLTAVQIAVLLCALLVSLVVTPIARRIAKRLGAVEQLDGRKIHRTPTPYLGGVAIYATLWMVVGGGLLAGLLLTTLTGGVPWMPDSLSRLSHQLGPAELRLLAIFAGGTVIMVVGLADDLRDQPVWLRFSVQFLAAVAVVVAGVVPEHVAVPRWIGAPVAVVWIVGMTNAFNFIDGMDGLCAGVGAIATAILAVYLNATGQPITALFLLALTGALLGFLRWNFYPARIFLGNAGSMLIGYLLGVMTLEGAYLTLEDVSVLPAILPILVLGVPLYDAGSVIVIRLANGRSPFKADTNHLHHRLRRTGLTDKQVVLFVYLLAFALGINAVLLAKLDTLGGLVLLTQVCAVMGCVILLERIIRRNVVPRGIAALPCLYTVIAADDRVGAELELPFTGRARDIHARGCVLEPGASIGGEITDLLAERRHLVLAMEPPDDDADRTPIRLRARLRGIDVDDSTAQELRIEFLRVPGHVQERLEVLRQPTTARRVADLTADATAPPGARSS
ncbi:MAG: glycosyltransferase family 4 protein [Planctomycetota bacterium]|jgi:UDP-GlcNAc:undecaprenyl-phosphate GlcNAc-1-phosphate transferase